MTANLDLDAIVADGYLRAGMKPSVVAAKSDAGKRLVEQLRLNERGRNRRAAPNSNTWSQADDDYVRAHYRFMSEAQIGRKLGRSAHAVHLRWKRDLRLPAPSKHPEELTALKVAAMMGVDGHTSVYWVDSGILPGRVLHGGRRIRLVKRSTLLRWVANPESWLRFDVAKVRDAKLKRLIELRQARWDDEWWDTRQVAAYHKADLRAVTARIWRNQMPAVKVLNYSGRHAKPRWSYSFVRKSDAITQVFTRGKGSTRANVFLVAPALSAHIETAVGAGLPQVCVAKMVGWSIKSLSYWLRTRKGGVAAVAAVAFVDWREHARRLPFLSRAVRRFLGGRSLSYDQMLCISGVLQAWRDEFGADVRVPRGHTMKRDLLWRAYQRLRAAGIDPFRVRGRWMRRG